MLSIPILLLILKIYVIPSIKQAPIVHPDKMDLFPGVSRGGGFQLWAPSGKGPPLRAPPGDTLPEIDATDGRHIIGKVCAESDESRT